MNSFLVYLFVKFFFTLSAIALGAIFFIFSATAVSAKTVISLNAATVQKGYTATFSDGKFKVGIPGGVLNQAATLEMEQSTDIPAPKPGTQFESSVMEFRILGDAVLNPNSALWVSLTPTVPLSNANVGLYSYDRPKNIWYRLPATVDVSRNIVKTTTRMRYLKLALLREESLTITPGFNTSIDGKATYYAGRRPDEASTHWFPGGTKLRVTNMRNGKSTVVTVIGSWANATAKTDRVIDLSKIAFKKIGTTFEGIISVRLEPIR